MLIDIAVNITDTMFDGVYNNQRRHANDIDAVISRSKYMKTFPIFIGLNYSESLKCTEYARKYKTLSYVGIHPTEASSDDVEKIIPLLANNRVIALGECGLDYARTRFASISKQKMIFQKQLEIQHDTYFFHCRDSHRDFMEMISDFNVKGVVHSFTGSSEEYDELVRKGLYVGLNGCSLREPELIRHVSPYNIVIGTDSPYCQVKGLASKYINKSCTPVRPQREYPIMKKRNEPCNLIQVCEAIAGIKDLNISELSNQLFKNTVKCFGGQLEASINEFFK